MNLCVAAESMLSDGLLCDRGPVTATLHFPPCLKFPVSASGTECSPPQSHQSMLCSGRSPVEKSLIQKFGFCSLWDLGQFKTISIYLNLLVSVRTNLPTLCDLETISFVSALWDYKPVLVTAQGAYKTSMTHMC